jgi:hypothetical protein
MNMIKVTVIIKDVTDAFFEGMGDSIAGLLNMTDSDKFTHLNKQQARFPMKIGNGSFGDRVELNSMTKGPHTITFKLEPRRGYKLATFTFSKA